jgi:hypothetical protein
MCALWSRSSPETETKDRGVLLAVFLEGIAIQIYQKGMLEKRETP